MQYLQERALQRQSEAVAAQAMLNNKVAQLESGNNALSAEIARLKRSAQIDQRIQSQLRKEMLTQQAEIAEFRRKVAFFESILQPDEQQSGVVIHKVAAQPLEQRDGFELALTLTQSGNHHRAIKGVVDFQLMGRDGDQQAAFGADICQPDMAWSQPFEFKYFQVLSVRCALQAALPAAWVSIAVKAQGRKAVLRTLKIR